MNKTDYLAFEHLFYLNLQSRLKNERCKNQMTQVELAQRIGCTRTHISHIETGRSHISLPELYICAEVLNCTIDSLCRMDGIQSEITELLNQEYDDKPIRVTTG